MRMLLVIGLALVLSLAWGQASKDQFVIDRFEDEGWVVLETFDGSALLLPRSWVPEAAKEGDVLRVVIDGDGLHRSVAFEVDVAETLDRRRWAEGLRDLLEKGPRGDIDL
jgi:hypothetical protein